MASNASVAVAVVCDMSHEQLLVHPHRQLVCDGSGACGSHFFQQVAPSVAHPVLWGHPAMHGMSRTSSSRLCVAAGPRASSLHGWFSCMRMCVSVVSSEAWDRHGLSENAW